MAITRKVDRKGRITLFRDFADQLVVMERIDGNILIRKAELVPKKLSLKALLAQITPDNIHDEISTGRPVGREKL